MWELWAKNFIDQNFAQSLWGSWGSSNLSSVHRCCVQSFVHVCEIAWEEFEKSRFANLRICATK